MNGFLSPYIRHCSVNNGTIHIGNRNSCLQFTNKVIRTGPRNVPSIGFAIETFEAIYIWMHLSLQRKHFHLLTIEHSCACNEEQMQPVIAPAQRHPRNSTIWIKYQMSQYTGAVLLLALICNRFRSYISRPRIWLQRHFFNYFCFVYLRQYQIDMHRLIYFRM